MARLRRAQVLAAAPVFAALPPATLWALAGRASSEVLAVGQRRATRRRGGDQVLVVASGRGQVGDVRVAAGAVVGLATAVTDAAPSELAAGVEAIELVVVAADEVRELVAEYPLAARAAASYLAGAAADRAGGAA